MTTTCAFCAPVLLPTSGGLYSTEAALTRRPRTRPHRLKRAPAYATATAPTPTPTSEPTFGLGARFPRRLVGIYELKRLGVDPEQLIKPNSRAENGLGFAVGLGVLATFLVPAVSPWVQLEAPVAGVIAIALTLWAVDTLALNGILQQAAEVGLSDRRRVVAHEAGHMLVAHLMGVAVEGYQLPNAAAVVAGKSCGVVIAEEDVGKADAYDLAALGMAGIAAECAVYGDSQGGAEDMAEVGRVAGSTTGRTATDKRMIVRWGLMQALTLVKAHEVAMQKLGDAMARGDSVEDCIKVIDENVDREALKKVKKPDGV